MMFWTTWLALLIGFVLGAFWGGCQRIDDKG